MTWMIWVAGALCIINTINACRWMAKANKWLIAPQIEHAIARTASAVASVKATLWLCTAAVLYVLTQAP